MRAKTACQVCSALALARSSVLSILPDGLRGKSSTTTTAEGPGLAEAQGGQAATFTITAVDDPLLDGTQTVTLTAWATGYINGTRTVSVTDSIWPAVFFDGNVKVPSTST